MKQALIKGAKSDEVLGLLNRIEQIQRNRVVSMVKNEKVIFTLDEWKGINGWQ